MIPAHYELRFCRCAAAAGQIQNHIAIEVVGELAGIPRHRFTGDHQTGLTDKGGVHIYSGRRTVVQEEADAAVVEHIERCAGICFNIAGPGKDHRIHLANDGGDLVGPVLNLGWLL